MHAFLRSVVDGGTEWTDVFSLKKRGQLRTTEEADRNWDFAHFFPHPPIYAGTGGELLEKKIRSNESKTNVTSICVHAIRSLRACSIVPKIQQGRRKSSSREISSSKVSSGAIACVSKSGCHLFGKKRGW